MDLNKNLAARCDATCELCNNKPAQHAFLLSPKTEEIPENQVALCDECLINIESKDKADYWRILEGSIWNPQPSVQALSYRLLQSYQSEEWANDVINSIELDENIVQWAMSAFEVATVHRDAFGNELLSGDTVVLTQNLNVKGTSFTAPKGTIVKKIRLVSDNTEQIEGKINEQLIVILTKYVKKG